MLSIIIDPDVKSTLRSAARLAPRGLRPRPSTDPHLSPSSLHLPWPRWPCWRHHPLHAEAA